MKCVSLRRRRILSVVLPALTALALFAAACQDSVTMPDLAAPTLSSGASTTSPYTCFTSIATPGGQYRYRYGRLQLKFPKEALAPDGSTTRYRYRGYASGAALDRMADCVIPRSAVAVEMMHRRFGVHDRLMKQGGESSDGGVTIMDTQIDGIVITACQYGGEYPSCNPPPTGYQEDPNPPVTECSTYCDPWSDDGGSGAGGSGTMYDGPPMSEEDAFMADTPVPNCNQPKNDQERAYCQGISPDSVREQKIRGALDRIAARGDACSRLAQAGRSLLGKGQFHLFDLNTFQFSDPSKKFSGSAALGGDWLVLSLDVVDLYEMTLTSDGRNLEQILAHELDHHLKNITSATNAVGHLKTSSGTVDPYKTLNSQACSGLPA